LAKLAYDANGNTLSDAQGRSFTWDFENRLTQAIVPGANGGTTTFRYDPFGRRIQKSGPLGITNFAYDGNNLIETMNSSGTVVARYTHGPTIDQPLAVFQGSATDYYEADTLGSVTSLSNGAGALANTYTYDSYGKLTASTGTIANPFQYTGREFDPEIEVYYYRARYYDQAAGRFISEDPLEFFGGQNFYAYVGNGPLNSTDPFGFCKDKCLQDANRRFTQSTQGPGPWHTLAAAQPNLPRLIGGWGVGGVRTWNWSWAGLGWSYWFNLTWNGSGESISYWKQWYAANEQYERDVEACESQ